MNRELLSLLAVCGVQLASGCAGSSGGGGATTPPVDTKCQLNAQGEQTPGFPFDTASFSSAILPLVVSSCGAAGCHQSPAGNGGFIVWADAATVPCDLAQTFNSFTALVDTATPTTSRILAAVTGNSPGHPLTYQSSDPNLATLTKFITTAATTLAAAGGGGNTAPAGASPYDYAVFQSTIEPAFDRAGCAKAGCHGSAAGGFSLKLSPAANSADMQANFTAITGFGALTGDPTIAIINVQATHLHGNNASTQLDAAGDTALLAWITAAQAAAGAAGNQAGTCPPIAGFNLGVFSSEILPILAGTVDLNQVGNQGHGGGCEKSNCHGTDRGAGTLALVPGTDPSQLLQNFACFVNVTVPQQSEILLCPDDLDGCRKRPHPGGNFFDGATDLNYQRVLSFIYASKLNISPFDYAFFVRKINPIFSDPASVQDAGLDIMSCADTAFCHGISAAGQTPPNGSDLGVLANVSDGDDASLTYNFVAVSGFVNFLDPTQSSMILYPTDGIQDTVNNKLATGIAHPGGPDFAANSQQATDILTWAQGLRPDAQGFVRNWLVLGDFSATLVTDNVGVPETTVTPKIFDRGGGSANNGVWDGFFSDSANIDLTIPFTVKQGVTRAAFASAFMINGLSRTQTVALNISSDNPTEVFVNGTLAAQAINGGQTSAIINLGGQGSTTQTAHILVKVLQRANDATFAFKAQTTDNLGNVLVDNGSILFTLAPNGGF
jgi:hypothetical protein